MPRFGDEKLTALPRDGDIVEVLNYSAPGWVVSFKTNIRRVIGMTSRNGIFKVDVYNKFADIELGRVHTDESHEVYIKQGTNGYWVLADMATQEATSA